MQLAVDQRGEPAPRPTERREGHSREKAAMRNRLCHATRPKKNTRLRRDTRLFLGRTVRGFALLPPLMRRKRRPPMNQSIRWKGNVRRQGHRAHVHQRCLKRKDQTAPIKKRCQIRTRRRPWIFEPVSNSHRQSDEIESRPKRALLGSYHQRKTGAEPATGEQRDRGSRAGDRTCGEERTFNRVFRAIGTWTARRKEVGLGRGKSSGSMGEPVLETTIIEFRSKVLRLAPKTLAFEKNSKQSRGRALGVLSRNPQGFSRSRKLYAISGPQESSRGKLSSGRAIELTWHRTRIYSPNTRH